MIIEFLSLIFMPTWTDAQHQELATATNGSKIGNTLESYTTRKQRKTDGCIRR